MTPVYARLEIALAKSLEEDEARTLFSAQTFLPQHAEAALTGTLFSKSERAASTHVVYSGDNGGYVIIVLWYTGFALEVVVEPHKAKIRRAADESWQALAKTLEAHVPSLDSAYLVEHTTEADLEKGTQAFRAYLASSIGVQTLLTACLTLVLSGVLALQSSGSLTRYLLAAASALSAFVVAIFFAVRSYRSKKLVWETIR
jgi:hypothetical protein